MEDVKCELSFCDKHIKELMRWLKPKLKVVGK